MDNAVLENLKGMFEKDLIKVAYFLSRSNILHTQQRIEKVKKDDHTEKVPTSIIDMDYLGMCFREKRLEKRDYTGLCFLCYQDFPAKNYKLYWKLDMDKAESDLKHKCNYCKSSFKSCPFKTLTFIREIAKANNVDEKDMFKALLDEPTKITYPNKDAVKEIADELMQITTNPLDYYGAEFFIETGALNYDGIDDNKHIHYTGIDFVTDGDLMINLEKFFIKNEGIKVDLDLNNIHISENYSYLFDHNPIELAALIDYRCDQKIISVESVLQELSDRIKRKEPMHNLTFYKEFVRRVQELECTDRAKEQLIEMFTYIKNYNNITSLPYIKMNTAIYSDNDEITEEIQRLMLHFFNAFGYSDTKGFVTIDVEVFMRKNVNPADVYFQIDKVYFDNDFVVFRNFDNFTSFPENKKEAFLAGIKKNYDATLKTTTLFICDKEYFDLITKDYKDFKSDIVNYEIEVEDYGIDIIKAKVKHKLKSVFDFNQDQEKLIDEYIENKCSHHEETADEYIKDICDDIIFDIFKDDKLRKVEFPKEGSDISSLVTMDILKEEKSRDLEEIKADFQNLVGLPEVKSTISDILNYIEFSKEADSLGSLNLNMIFKGNEGTGKSTVGKLLAELYFKLGILKKNKFREVSSKDLIGEFIGQTPKKTEKVIEDCLDGVLYIDDANLVASTKGATTDFGKECMTTLVDAMDKYKDRLVIIFAGWTKSMNEFTTKNANIAARVGYEIEFEDLTVPELAQIFERELKESGFEAEEVVYDRVNKLLEKNKIGKNIGNARFPINLVNALIITHAANYKKNGGELKKITENDIRTYEETKKDKERSLDEILADLNSLIGLQVIKEKINGFVALMQFDRKLGRTDEVNMHMIFKGNAGTGKTTVARLIAEIYYNLGFIKKNKLVEVQGKDLIGEYIGHTGPKTQAVIESALDGVLFVDEAYSILMHRGMQASFTDECIATILKAMEDYMGRLIIIFAGYTEEMKQFRDQNPGLKSRIGFELDFPDYSVDELVEILRKKVKDRDLEIDEDAVEKARKVIARAREVENFGNGRYIDQFVQKIVINHAIRLQNEEDLDKLRRLTKDDIIDLKAETSRNRIGFNMN